MTRSEAAKLAIKAATKAGLKTLGISALLTAPGIVLLSKGYILAGSAWLFLAAFSMMAWTYRKPWRLGVISCLLPPLMAGLSYCAQLYIFGAVVPGQLVAIAMLAGLVVGWLRASSHNVRLDDRGAPVADRTFGYLLIWALAYGATQLFGYFAMDSFQTRAGLVTGAFTTTMLAVVSVMIWLRKSKLLGPATAAAMACVLLGSVGVFTPERAIAQEATAAGAQTVLQSLADSLERELNQLAENDNSVGIESISSVTGDDDRAEFETLIYSAHLYDDVLYADGIISVRLVLERFGDAAQAQPPALPNDLNSANFELIDIPEGIVWRNTGRSDSVETVTSKGPYRMTATSSVRRWDIYVSGREGPEYSLLVSPMLVISLARNALDPDQEAEDESGGGGGGMTMNTQVCMTASGQYIPFAIPPGGDPMELARRCVGGPTTCLDLKAQRHPDTFNCPWVPDGNETGLSFGGSEDGSEGEDGEGLIGESEPTTPEMQEQLVAVTAAIAAALVAAGIAINMAQAIAAAIANALQAAGQLTAEDIQNAIMEALSRQGSGEGSANGQASSNSGDSAPPNTPQTERVRPPTPIYQPDGTAFDTNNDGQYWAPDGNGNWRWLTRAQAQEAAAALAAEEAQRGREGEAHQRAAEQDLQASRDRFAQQAARDRQAQQAHDELNRIRRAADKQDLDDLWQRSVAANVYNPDGSINLDQLARLRHALRGRLMRDGATSDPDFDDNSWTRIIREGAGGTADDTSNSFWARAGLGMASGGWSEAFFQGRGTWDAVRQAAEDATDRGEEYTAANAAKTTATQFANDNLPVNTYNALTREGKPASWGELGMSVLADAAAVLDVGEAGTKVTGVTGGDVAERIGRGVLGDQLTDRARDTIAAGQRRVGDAVNSAATRVQDLDNRATDWINRRTGGAGEMFGLQAANGPDALAARQAAQQVDLDEAQARFDRGDISSETQSTIDNVRDSGTTSTLDDAHAAGRERGRQQVEALENSLSELEQARASGTATAEELADLQRRVRDETVRVQGDKHAMNELNGRNSDGSGSSTIEAFNGEMGRIHSETDQRMVQRLADEYGVRPEDVEIVNITNQRGQAAGIDPSAPARPSEGLASRWTEDGTVQGNRATRSEPGVVDGPDTGRLPEAEARAPSAGKAGMDRDVTVRVRSVDANGNIIYRDVPSSVTGRIYNEEFFEAATGRSRPDPSVAPTGADGAAGTAAETASEARSGGQTEADAVTGAETATGGAAEAASNGSSGAGATAEAPTGASAAAEATPPHASTDFKDTHLSAQQAIGDPLEISDPQAFSRRMDQATTDRLHAEAYGTGQGDLLTATNDVYRGRDLSDAAGTSHTIEYKVDHWMNESSRLQEMADLPENAGIRSQLLEQAAAQMEEAQRQLVKQHGNMVLRRTQAMALLDNAPGARIPPGLTERINVLQQAQSGRITPAQAEATLRSMGSSTQDVGRQMSAYVEGLQTLRRPNTPPTGIGRPATVVQGWQDDFPHENGPSDDGNSNG